MINTLDILLECFNEYMEWLRNHGISERFVRERLQDRHKETLLRAFRRKRTMNWKITEHQRELISLISKHSENKRMLANKEAGKTD